MIEPLASTARPKADEPLVAAKVACRARMVDAIRRLSTEEHRAAEAAASRSLVALLRASIAPGAPIALFAATPTELGCTPAIRMLENDHPLAFPRVAGDRLRFQLAAYDSLDAHTSKIREPAPDAPEVAPAAIVIPARAFDRRGIRLGRGAGYFDRTLADLPAKTLLIGHCFDLQLVDELPRAPHDARVHVVVTERGEPLRCRPLAAPDATPPDAADRGATRPPWT